MGWRCRDGKQWSGSGHIDFIARHLRFSPEPIALQLELHQVGCEMLHLLDAFERCTVIGIVVKESVGPITENEGLQLGRIVTCHPTIRMSARGRNLNPATLCCSFQPPHGLLPNARR